jgi:hypothetical protein
VNPAALLSRGYQNERVKPVSRTSCPIFGAYHAGREGYHHLTPAAGPRDAGAKIHVHKRDQKGTACAHFRTDRRGLRLDSVRQCLRPPLSVSPPHPLSPTPSLSPSGAGGRHGVSPGVGSYCAFYLLHVSSSCHSVASLPVHVLLCLCVCRVFIFKVTGPSPLQGQQNKVSKGRPAQTPP